MEISCTHCSKEFNIPDDKIPKGRKVSLRCPKCRQVIHIVAGEEGIQNVEAPNPPAAQSSSAAAPYSYQNSEIPVYNAADRPFGGILDRNAKTAMICVGYPHANELAVKVMNSMQYHIMNVDNVQTSLTSMIYHLFDIIIVDDDFDINRRGCRNILDHINQLDMASRRKLIVIMISKTMHTLDNMAAFHTSVNQIINYNQVNSMENLIHRAVIEHEQVYAVYNETLKKLGKLT